MEGTPTYLDRTLSVEERADDLISRMTLEEKFSLLSSQGRHRIYTTKGIGRLNIPAFKMTDGPLGVARHSSWFKKNTRFPATISLAASWNRGLQHNVGIAMGKEVRASGRHVLLAPGINIQRTPLCGRTFEYYSEDPYLTKELAIPFVRGVQSQDIAACAKHYVANNQETDRKTISAEIDERTLHEMYLRAFKALVTDAGVWTIMTCYNKVNGDYGAANRYLIREVLMGEWGFDGMVMTDWMATGKIQSTEDCIEAGLTLEMPFPTKYKVSLLKKAYKNGKFTEATLHELVRKNIRTMFRTRAFGGESVTDSGERNTAEHQQLARHAAEEGIVLLKNEGNLLPLNRDELCEIALLGPNLKKKFGKFLYGGSSAVVPPYEITPFEGMKKKCTDMVKISTDPADADLAILFMGLDHSRGNDSEGHDKEGLRLPRKQVELIRKTVNENENTIVVLIAGSPIAMDPWLKDVPVVLNAWYSGMESGNAIANVLFGNICPSGRLPITFPKKLSDSPAHHSGDSRNYPGDEEKRVYYDEGIFVGYRWYDTRNIEPLFPFGHGLSYSTFDFKNVDSEITSLSSHDDSLTLSIELKNVGDVAGSEVIQVYSRDLHSSVDRPIRELVGFEKVFLHPDESKMIPIEIRAQDLGFYDTSAHNWLIEPGEFQLDIGKSSCELELDTVISYS